MISIVEEILKIEKRESNSINSDNAVLVKFHDKILQDVRYSNSIKKYISSRTNEYPYTIFNRLYNWNVERVIDGKMFYERDFIYEDLEQINFNFNSETKLAIRDLALKKEFSEYSAYDLKNHNNTGYKNIEDIVVNFEDKSYTIYTNSGEVYKFYLASDYFKDNEELDSFIKKSIGKNNCHAYTESLQNYFPEGVSVTSYCLRFTNNNYYSHSYMEFGDMVIDLNFNIVMNKEMYYRLMQPKELLRINNSEMKFYQRVVEIMLEDDPKKELLKDHYLLLLIAEIHLACQNNPELHEKYINVCEFVSQELNIRQ